MTICSKCGTSETCRWVFLKNSNKPILCSTCYSQLPERKEYSKEYSKNNKKYFMEYNAEYRKNNKEKIKEDKKEFNKKN